MRSHYLIVLLLLSIPALAQEVTISIGKSAPNEADFPDHYLYSNYKIQPYTYGFGTTQVISKVSLSLRAMSTCVGACTTTPVCVYFDGNTATQTCTTIGLTSYQKAWRDIEIKPARQANTLTITLSTATPWNANGVRLQAIRWTGGNSIQINRNLLSLKGDDAINFGPIRTIIDVTGLTGDVMITSNNPKAIAWFDEGQGQSATTRTTTPNYEDFALACADIDTNKICDYVDEDNCADNTPSQDWYGGKCCGDAPYNPPAKCGWYADKMAVCGENSQGRWIWAAIADTGLITKIDGACPSAEIVSDGTKFYTCAETLPNVIPSDKIVKITDKITIEEHEYFCEGEKIIECGGETPYTPTGLKTGASKIFSSKKHYCTTEGKWATSLDGINSQSCTKSGLKWTGTRCCGEQDDDLKTYEDQYTGQGLAGGCFNNQFIASGTNFAGDKEVINYRGEFYICDPSLQEGASGTTTSSLYFQNTGITPKTRGPCGTPLQQAILQGTENHIICNPNGEWMFTSSTEDHDVKQTKWIPTETEQKQGCCPENKCWDGKQCRPLNYYFVIGDKGYRCQ